MRAIQMTSEELFKLPEKQVFDWLLDKTWTLMDFRKWSEEVKVHEYGLGYTEGWDTAKGELVEDDEE